MRRAFWHAVLLLSGAAFAGPPYVSDDPEPSDFRHYEIYVFTAGTTTAGGSGGASGIDFNYGAAPDLQLTAVPPIAYQPGATRLGNVELAARYPFAHQREASWDITALPRLFLPSAPPAVGERRTSLLGSVWLERDWERWSTFGGGLRYDLSKMYHLLVYFGPGLQNRDVTDRYSWYAALLMTL